MSHGYTDLETLAASVREDSKRGMAWNAGLLAIAAIGVYVALGGFAALSTLMGGMLGAANFLAIAWLTGRILKRGEKGMGSSMALVGLKFLGLIGVVGAVVLLFRPDILPFLIGFSTSIPVIVGICLLRFSR